MKITKANEEPLVNVNGSHFYNSCKMYKNTENNMLIPIDFVKVRNVLRQLRQDA